MNFHISQDIDSLSQDIAEWLIEHIQKTLSDKARYALALSGGSTPKELYTLLARPPYRDQIDWKKMHIFFGDERYVPFDDDRNNGKMAYETLLRHVPIPEKQIHYFNTTFSPEQSASEYSKILHHYFDNQPDTFDLVLLGMGDDGHTLSLFPGTAVIHEDKKWVKAYFVEKLNMFRITLTVPVVIRSSAVAFLAVGEKKAATLKEVIEGNYSPDKYPSQIIKPVNGNLHWFLDKAAASRLKNTH
ncbi:MAG: 6-phosphogluconolactonase [Chitinophagaceae bacterium]|nr:MAG: 6-phosphogluconolactonase [Chitinophagaceae bacterium]